ncbi:HVO_A0556 family zinc finger protein [Natronolimnohabitans sp. A-GB9]|uniref:HVO_A0556 family zinc finger protein n=1 Tax=Natronolimnohabitans sp. A-GB9 TaxID=3069757 RepID=UPI0027B2032A|nr:HVO_A0556 family zinc finger protein [Natronolimnohabitans sp. A-GB9]MDQ2049980.1 HVO_A0556 family zinc finger protein [Natronolimnohabitans sp. A-GB9]
MAKSQSSPTGGADRQLLAALEGQACPYCTDGTLERGIYKDNQAVVCESCDTPRVQLWQPGE